MKKSILTTLIIVLLSTTISAQDYKFAGYISAGYAELPKKSEGYFIGANLNFPLYKSWLSISPQFSYASSVKSDYAQLGGTNVENLGKSNVTQVIRGSNVGGETMTSLGALAVFTLFNAKEENKFNVDLGLGFGYNSILASFYFLDEEIASGFTNYSYAEIQFSGRINLNYKIGNNSFLGLNFSTNSISDGNVAGFFGVHYGYRVL